MSKNTNKIFYILPRKYSYGGILQSIIKAIPLAKYFKKEIKIIDVSLNPKSKGSFLIKNVNNINCYKKLLYNDEQFNYFDLNIISQKLKIFIKIAINKSFFFSKFIKFCFLIFYLNFNKSKEKYRKFFHDQDYYNSLLDLKTYNYLKTHDLIFDEGVAQKIHFNRLSFQLSNQEVKKIENNKIFSSLNFKEKFACLYIREKSYNDSHSYLKKENNKIWYNHKNFKDSLNYFTKNRINIFDVSNLECDFDIEKGYTNLKNLNITSEELNYFLSSKAEFFISTGGGKSELARLFKKPILRIDHEYDVLNNFSFSTKYDHVLFPNIYSKIKKRFLSIEEQFLKLDEIFPNFKKNLNFEFNKEDFLIIKNTNEEILNLVKNYDFNLDTINQNKIEQHETFNIKNEFIKRNTPKHFFLISEYYPEHPLICKDFFKKNNKYTEYLDAKTQVYNSKNM